MIVPNPIRAAQRALGLTDRDALFATLLDVTEALLVRATAGDRDARDEVVRAAALVLGIEPHELLFDGPGGRATTALLETVVDPEHASAFEEAVHQHLQLREQRANAFAAYLLAPPRGVAALFPRGAPPKSSGTVDAVAEHFGLSRVTALNVVQNVFGWS